MKTTLLILLTAVICSAQSTYLSIGLNGGVSTSKGYKPDACLGLNLGAGFNIGKMSVGLENGISNINYFKEHQYTDVTGSVVSTKTNNLSYSFSYYNISLPVSLNIYKGLSLFGKPSYNLAIVVKRTFVDDRNYDSRSISKENNISLEGGLKYSLGGKNKVDLGLSYLRQINGSLYPNASCFLLSIGYRINSK